MCVDKAGVYTDDHSEVVRNDAAGGYPGGE